MMHDFELHEIFHSPKNVHLKALVYIEMFSPKKTGFSPLKNISQNYFDFFLPLFNFSVWKLQYFQKNFFLPMKTLKNKPQKLFIIGPKLFFHSNGPAA